MNEKIDVIKNQYKEAMNLEIDKIRKNLIKAAGNNLKDLKDKYNNMYLKKEEELNKKCNGIKQ